MATHTVNIDVIDKTIPIGNNRVIPVINQPNPALGYAASANEVAQLLQLANYYVYEAGTDTIINPYNYYDYFPEAGGGGGGGGGGVTPQTVQSMIDASIDSTVSDTSTKAVQNAAITNFVNSSIESSTAEFKGTYDSKVEMDAVTANQNDYAFLCVLNNDGSVNHYERYKWSDTEVSGSHWLFEYNVNNSSFTAKQWAAINSGVKDTDVSALGGHVNNTNNPHSVTKAQVGLSDVDNTSDADKPISTATQNALNTKFDTAGTGLNKNGTTVSHATPEGAATHAKAFYKFSTDALGHVNGVTEATEAEVNAIDSGITAAKVGQIETNKNNILLIESMNGRKNQINIPDGTYVASTSSFSASGGAVTSTATDNNTHAVDLSVWTLKAGTYVFFDDSSDLSAVQYRIYQQSPDTRLTPAGQNPATFTIANDTVVYLSCYTFKTGTMTTHPMLMTKTMWDAGFTDYQPYALSNAELSAKEQQNENNILTVADQSTQYNIVPIKSTITTGNASVTATVAADKSITIEITGTTSSNIGFEISDNFTIDTNTEYVMTGNPSAGAIRLILQQAANPYTWIGQQYNNQASAVTSNISFVRYYVFIYSGSSGTITIKPMLTPKSLYDAGFTEYQPYALSNVELTAKEQANENIISSIYTQNGRSYNILDLSDVAYMATSITYIFDNATGSVIGSCTTATYQRIVWNLPITIGIRYRIDFDVASYNSAMMLYPTKATIATTAPYGQVDITAAGHYSLEFTPDVDTLYLCLYFNTDPAKSNSITIRNLRIIPKSAYDAGFNEFVPYALSNATITPALKECVDNGAKNMLNFANLGSPTLSHVTYTKTATDITCTSNGSWAYIMFPFSLVGGNYNLSFVVSNYSKSGGVIRVTLYTDTTATTAVDTKEVTGNGSYNFDFTWTGGTLYLGIYVNQNGTSYTNTVTIGQIMICTQTEYNVSPTYQPHALPNTTITPVLKECVDNGVKNLLSYTLADIKSYNSNGVSWNGNVCTVGNLIFTINSDMSVTVSGSQGTGSAYLVLAKNVSYPAIRLQGCPAGGGSSIYQLQAYYSSAPTTSANDNGTGVSVAANTWSEICITIRPNQTFSNPITFKPMAIPQSLYDAGFTDYQPYAMSNADLTPHTANVVKSNFTATDWTKVDELAFEIPTGKIAEFSASATRDTTTLVKGIAFVNDDTFSIDRVLAISENANESYYALAVHGIRSRKNFTSETVNVFVKYSAAPVSSNITRTYRFV